MGQFSRWTHAAFFLLFAALLFFVHRPSMFYDPGTFWHIVTGERILESGFLDTDPYSYTFGGREWIPTQWLAECLLALQHRLYGLEGVLWAAITLLAALYAWLANRFVQNGCHPLLALLFVGLFIGVSSYHFHVRPHLVSIAFLGWTFALLVDVDAGRRAPRCLWWLVPLFTLWTNLHGGMLAGLGTLVLTTFGWLVLWLTKIRSPITTWRLSCGLCVLVLLCGLTALVNPYGWRLPWTWYVILQADLPDLILEHAPLDPTDSIGIAVLVVGGFYLLMLLGVRPRQLRVTWLLPLVWLVLAWTRVRHGPLFVIVAAVALSDLVPHCRWIEALKRRGLFANEPRLTAKPRWSIAWSFLLLPVTLFLAPMCLGRGWVQLDPRHWPLELVPELRAQVAGKQTRVFHEDVFGGFLIYYVPETAVFVDDRYELYGREFIHAYAQAVRREPHTLDEWRRQYGFNLALTHTDSSFTRHLKHSPDWRLLRESRAACLFVAQPNGSPYTNGGGDPTKPNHAVD